MWINIGSQGEEREEAMLLRNGRATVGCAASGIPSSAGFLLGFQTQASAFCVCVGGAIALPTSL